MIAVRGLSRSFGDRTVFRSQELEAPRAGLIALRGPNGSGKTTLLRILSTLTEPTSGDAWVAGRSVLREARGARARLGFVPSGDAGMYRRLTGLENLRLFGGLCGLSGREADRAIDRWREVLRLEDALSTRFGLASSGMRQSLLLCRALLHDPAVLLMDEPARALDPEAKARLWSALRELARGKAILFSSHDPGEWGGADQVWQIEGGLLACSAPC